LKKIDHIVKEATYKEMFFIAHYENDFPVYEDPHRHNFFEILWLTKGTGIQDIDGAKFSLSANDLFLISEGQVHSISNTGNISGYLLCFKEDFWHYAPASVRNFETSLFNNLLINSYLHLEAHDGNEITSLLESMLREYEKPDYSSKTELLAAYMKVLLIKIDMLKTASFTAAKANAQEYHLFEKLVQLVEMEYSKMHDVTYYASQLAIAPRKLSIISQLFSGNTAKELIDRRIISEAKRFLQFSDLSIKEIASELNFADQYQFSKFFKKHTALSPVSFRLQFAEIDI
jgi:AraC family transcriptional activator of pobA